MGHSKAEYSLTTMNAKMQRDKELMDESLVESLILWTNSSDSTNSGTWNLLYVFEARDNIVDIPSHVTTSATKIILSLMYATIILCSIFGNIVTLWIIGFFKDMKTKVNMFICSLAISDLIITFICIPFQLVMVVVDNGSAGTLCANLFLSLRLQPLLSTPSRCVALPLNAFVPLFIRYVIAYANGSSPLIGSL